MQFRPFEDTKLKKEGHLVSLSIAVLSLFSKRGKTDRILRRRTKKWRNNNSQRFYRRRTDLEGKIKTGV